MSWVKLYIRFHPTHTGSMTAVIRKSLEISWLWLCINTSKMKGESVLRENLLLPSSHQVNPALLALFFLMNTKQWTQCFGFSSAPAKTHSKIPLESSERRMRSFLSISCEIRLALDLFQLIILKCECQHLFKGYLRQWWARRDFLDPVYWQFICLSRAFIFVEDI